MAGKVAVKKQPKKKVNSSKKVASKKSVDLAMLRRKVEQVIEGLELEYPEAECELNYNSPEQLLIATILSAQCTDVQVNKVTAVLFDKYPDAESLAKARLNTVEKIIHSTGFYRNKSKNIIACAKALVKEHGGKVPPSLDELVKLPGAGRKTANVVLGNAFDIPGMVVDTHVKRITNLIGLTEQSDPVKIEQELMKIVEEKHWTMFSHWIIHHGRNICIARRPICQDCVIKAVCDYGSKTLENTLD